MDEDIVNGKRRLNTVSQGILIRAGGIGYIVSSASEVQTTKQANKEKNNKRTNKKTNNQTSKLTNKRTNGQRKKYSPQLD